MGIGTLLVERGLISGDQLEQALAEQRATGQRLDRVLVALGFIAPDAVVRVLGEQFSMPVVELDTLEVDAETLAALPASLVYRQRCVPISRDNGRLTLATSDPFELAALDELRLLTHCPIDLVLADEAELASFIRIHYGVGGDTLDALTAGDDSLVTEETSDEIEQAQEASVIKLVNDIIAEAIAQRATDVHFEPYETELAVRYRIDGVLQRASVPPTINRFAAAIVSRIKIMATLDIAEKRRPQDGRITFRRRIEARTAEFDLRVSIIPMLYGEGVVLRILNKTAVALRLEDLGMGPREITRWDALIARPHGILLVTGPTGSGKSTTLYASLARIVTDALKAVTIEDPVEYHVAGVNQIQVNPKTGLTFAAGLRSVLRHDPDVVMVGEIRDQETAETAIQASLTGHLVFSTLHTNDAGGAITRLIDMGVEPFLVSSSVEGVLAQRLVRRICPECAHTYTPDPKDFPRDFKMPESGTLVQGEGCKACRNTGYRGRLGVFELLTMPQPIRDLVMARASAPEIVAAAIAGHDLELLRNDGYAKVRAGVTTLAEVTRALA